MKQLFLSHIKAWDDIHAKYEPYVAPYRGRAVLDGYPAEYYSELKAEGKRFNTERRRILLLMKAERDKKGGDDHGGA